MTSLSMLNIPLGYGTRRGTFADVLALSPVPVWPEFARRLEAALYTKRVIEGIDIGVGEIGRLVNPVKPGAAPPASSFHEPHMGSTEPYKGAACAADMTLGNSVNGKHAVITDWSIVPSQARGESCCGLHSNVGDPYAGGTDEAWHWQPVEIDGFATWRLAGSPPVRFLDFPDPRPSEDDDMHIPIPSPQRAYDSRPGEQAGVDDIYREANKNVPQTQLAPGQPPRKVFVGMEKACFVVITQIGTTAGWVKVAGVATPPKSSIVDSDLDGITKCGAPVAIPDGHIYLWSNVACDVVVDVFDRWG